MTFAQRTSGIRGTTCGSILVTVIGENPLSSCYVLGDERDVNARYDVVHVCPQDPCHSMNVPPGVKSRLMLYLKGKRQMGAYRCEDARS